jgi:hypothetical protein
MDMVVGGGVEHDTNCNVSRLSPDKIGKMVFYNEPQNVR